jgi:hypothetical protein
MGNHILETSSDLCGLHVTAKSWAIAFGLALQYWNPYAVGQEQVVFCMLFACLQLEK